MISHPSSLWPAPSSNDRRPRRASWMTLLLLATLLLPSCGLLGKLHTEEEPSLDTRRKRLSRSLQNKLEWAVQSYEAGQYGEAIEKFEKLRAEGPAVPDFDLIPFYVGMSQYRLGNFPDTVRELESFLKASPTRQETQEARITLLLTYERQADWGKVLGLAAETDKQALFQYNRAVLKMVWARALAEQGELKGARLVRKDAEQYLENSGSRDTNSPIFSDPNQDLWGRFYYTSALIEAKACQQIEPRGIPEKKRLRRLYGPWLEAAVDCLRGNLNEAHRELFRKESAWGPQAGGALLEAVNEIGKRIKTFQKEEKEALDRRRALDKSAHENLYRLLGTLDELLKDLKNQKVESPPLEAIRKQTDLLLIQISATS